MPNYFISQAKLIAYGRGDSVMRERVCNGGSNSIMTAANL